MLYYQFYQRLDVNFIEVSMKIHPHKEKKNYEKLDVSWPQKLSIAAVNDDNRRLF